MSSDSTDNAELSEAAAAFLCSLNIGGNNESNTTHDDKDIHPAAICANCGKEGDGDNIMNTCNKCDLVAYCNATCKKKHKSKHKKKCERRAAGLFDEKLFKEPPPREECPICMLPLPLYNKEITFHSCCGKDICNGCIIAMVERKGTNILCAFCRTPSAESDEELVERTNNLIDKGNADACNSLAGYYANGTMGLPQDMAKSNELNLKAGELGCAEAYFNLGNAYDNGRGVEIDEEKAKYYWELAAMNGSGNARHNLGCTEGEAGNLHRACKHFILAARAGYKLSLDAVKTGFRSGIVTKDEYAQTLRAYHESQTEMKSEARDKAEAFSNHTDIRSVNG